MGGRERGQLGASGEQRAASYNAVFIQTKIKKGASRRPFDFRRFLLCGLRESALVACCRIPVNEPFPRSAIEQLHGGQSFLSGSAGRSLESGAERGFLAAVADGSGA